MSRSRILTATLVVALLASYLVGAIAASQRSAATMAAAANRFLAGLSAEQRQVATFAFDSDERLRWHFIPNEMFRRQGLALKEMTDTQRSLAHELLKTGLSQRGYLTATAVMDLERVLKALEAGGRFARDPDAYLFSVFGTPSTTGTWGWRVEGHHLSFHFTIANGVVAGTSPTFVGANPAEVREGPKRGLRVLGEEEDAARALLEALNPSQRAAAVIAQVAPGDIITLNALAIDPLSPVGIRAAALSAEQRDLLMRLIEVYTSMMSHELAGERLARLRDAGPENITFAWAGELPRGGKHYYRVQGPTFLIEYDNTQNDANHIHSVWRDFKGDFGRDLLREHVKEMPH
jgi:hypothetical protein